VTTDDDLDGCDVDMADPARLTGDDQVDALILFADVQFTDPAQADTRAAEWRELFG
jgi:hypothetical protein